ncbi:hypothetical protein R69888_05573 [Paraburkholderia haematera]|uniref:Uncharacterized protein n=1 Tax=Paraburkholderia haematera TaxID=2793077 RepID=A0ABM8SH70_9BURK|nr:hypothetical protein R69888_05573 [Paraburkholderia haematera]
MPNNTALAINNIENLDTTVKTGPLGEASVH